MQGTQHICDGVEGAAAHRVCAHFVGGDRVVSCAFTVPILPCRPPSVPLLSPPPTVGKQECGYIGIHAALSHRLVGDVILVCVFSRVRPPPPTPCHLSLRGLLNHADSDVLGLCESQVPLPSRPPSPLAVPPLLSPWCLVQWMAYSPCCARTFLLGRQLVGNGQARAGAR